MRQKLKKIKNNWVYLVSHYNSISPIAEQYRLIRNNIHFSSVDKEVKSIVVTSPESSDGKSTTAINLAIVLAHQEKSVLLVDSDLRKPSVHHAFNISNIHGLTSVLTKQISLESALVKSNIPNLDILTSGPTPPNPSELLGSKAMEMIVERLKSSFDYIVFDTPPILAVTDSQIMSNKCDGVVLVIASGKTNRVVAKKAKGLLEKANAPLLGVVVNRMKTEKGDFYYKYD